MGRLKGDRHLQYPQETTHGNLLIALGQKAGLEIEKMGLSNGTVDLQPRSRAPSAFTVRNRTVPGREPPAPVCARRLENGSVSRSTDWPFQTT